MMTCGLFARKPMNINLTSRVIYVAGIYPNRERILILHTLLMFIKVSNDNDGKSGSHVEDSGLQRVSKKSLPESQKICR